MTKKEEELTSQGSFSSLETQHVTTALSTVSSTHLNPLQNVFSFLSFAIHFKSHAKQRAQKLH